AHVGDSLCTIEEHRHTAGMRHPNDFMHRHNCSERVRNMRNRDEGCCWSKTALKFLEEQFTTVVNWCDDKACSGLFRQQLPRNNVGMMLKSGYQNLVTGFDARPGERIHHKVDSLRCAANKDDFAFASSVDELLHSRSRGFKSFRCAIAQSMYRSMNIRRVTFIKPIHGLDYCLRLLRRSGVVQIDKRFSMHLLMKSRKVPPDFQQIEFG